MRNAIKAASAGAMLFGGTLGATSAAEGALVTWNCNLAVSYYVGTSICNQLDINVETQKYNYDTEGGNIGNNGGGLTYWDLAFSSAISSSKMWTNTNDPASGMVGVSDYNGMARLAGGVVVGGSLASSFGYKFASTIYASTTAANAWTNGSTGYFGFQFKNAAGQVRYGWGELALNSGTMQEGTIVRFVYDDSGASVTTGVVPAPGALALLGVAGIVGGRRRR